MNKTILIIEDNAILANYLGCIVERYGNIDIANNGMEALKKLSQNAYDAIIFDVRKPAMNGIEFYQEASAMDLDIKKRVLFLISTVYKKHIKFMLDNHVHCLRKTLQSEDIRNALEKILFNSKSCLKSLDKSA